MIEYSNSAPLLLLLFKRRGSVVPKSFALAVFSGAIAIILVHLNTETDNFVEDFGADQISKSQFWGGMIATLSFLIGFRSNTAYARFWTGTTLLHQMWGEWYDASSCLVAFSTLARGKKLKEVENFRRTLIRLMSLCHASALEEISSHAEHEDSYPSLDIGGLDQKTLKYLRECKNDKELNFNRVEVLVHMIQTLVVNAHSDKVLEIPPPILSRVFQTLSRGQVHLMNCKKITNTLFPFPYAQLIALLLYVFLFSTPVLVSALCDDMKWAFIFTAVPVFGLFSLNYVARELEVPFGNDSNDLPLELFQQNMNQALLMLIRPESDHVACTSPQCAKDFASTKAGISGARLRSFIQDAASEEKATFQDLRSDDPVDMAPRQSTLQSLPLPAPPPISPVLNSAALEEALRTTTEDLSQHFLDLKANIKNLSEELRQNNKTMLQFSQAPKLPQGILDHAAVSAPKAPPETGFKFCSVTRT